MGDYSRDTFDRLKHYVGVRLQQGVPLIDADWAEMEDTRKNELQFYQKWFIGNGIPTGNDGFRILPLPAAGDDFLIKCGLNNQPGFCLVDGLKVRIENDIAYSAQSLFNNNDLAQKWGVAPLAPLTPPLSGQRPDLVYLDVWEREVTAEEDHNLINPTIGLETSVRIRREWVVRVAQGTTTLPLEPAGHAYYSLAHITRTAGDHTINQAGIYDLRRTDVTMASLLDSSVGCINPFTALNIPEGWLECNGQAIDRNRYSALFTRIGVSFGAGDGAKTFNVPDLRGEFIRGWDHGRGIDPGRAFGSIQQDQIQSHTHPDLGHTHPVSGHVHNESGHTHSGSGHSHLLRQAGYWLAYRGDYTDMGTRRSDFNGTFNTGTGYANYSTGTASMGKGYETVITAYANFDNPTVSIYGAPRHGPETRARNVALMYCIKY